MRTLLLLLIPLVGCTGAPPTSNVQDSTAPTSQATPAATIDFDDPETCAACHSAIVDEWKQSMHSRAHQDSDPLYAAMRNMRIKKQGQAMGETCNTCHTPRAAQGDQAAKNGVSCATCHAAEHVDRSQGPGAKALTYSKDHLFGPNDLAEGASSAHGTGPAADHLKDGTTMCLVCHDATQNPAGVAACTTGPEHTEGTTQQPCTECHMPTTAGPNGTASTRKDHRSHAFPGPHRAWYQDDPSFLSSAVQLDAQLDGTTATFTLTNKTGHSFPTGFPGRLAVLMVTGMDADGHVVYNNIDKQPMVDSPQSVINKVYVNGAGEPVPAAFAKELKRDNRLKPDETRQLTYLMPATAVSVKGALMFRLMPPKLSKKLRFGGEAESEPRQIATAQAP
ncbi:MAG: hypothetical protein ACI9MC_000920 [Kiritimatiellia bacterium]|jgi:hypothetical protein